MVPYFSAVPRNFAQNAFGASLIESRTDFRALSSPSVAQVATGIIVGSLAFVYPMRRTQRLLFNAKISSSRLSASETQYIAAKMQAVITYPLVV